MPFAFIIIGLILIICAARGTLSQLGTLLKGDFTGSGNFVYWIAAIGIVGTLGYVDTFRTMSRAFLSLVLISMILSNRGFFDQLKSAIEQLSSSTSSGSGAAGNTLDNSQAAPQQPGSGDTAGAGALTAQGTANNGFVGSVVEGLVPNTLGNIIGSGAIGF